MDSGYSHNRHHYYIKADIVNCVLWFRVKLLQVSVEWGLHNGQTGLDRLLFSDCQL